MSKPSREELIEAISDYAPRQRPEDAQKLARIVDRLFEPEPRDVVTVTPLQAKVVIRTLQNTIYPNVAAIRRDMEQQIAALDASAPDGEVADE